MTSAETQPPDSYRFRRLGAADVDAIHTLYRTVFDETPTGFLARRSREDFERILAGETFAGGIYRDETFVGYQIYNTVRELRFDEARYRKAAAIISSHRVLFGKGTVIAGGHQNAGLARRVSQFTSDLGREAGYRYRIGHAFVANLNSLKYQLGSGRTIIGISMDEFGLNFITCGYLGRTGNRSESGLCRFDDVDRIAAILETERIVAIRDMDGEAMFVTGDVEEFDD